MRFRDYPCVGRNEIKMKKVIVIGCPGSGKSTFSRKLRDKTGFPLFCLDKIWHKADRTTVTREEFDEALGRILDGDYYIIDGNYNRTLERRFADCDTVIWMNIPITECIKGVESRIGKEREDMPWVETEFSSDFREWIEGFPERETPKILSLIEKYKSEKSIVILRSHAEAQCFIEEL